MAQIFGYLSIFVLILGICTSLAQEYLSQCNPSAGRHCAPGKFLTCLAKQCQCEDLLNQIYDHDLGQCVILAERRCSGTLKGRGNAVDPRQLSLASPRCVANAFCDASTTTCQCSRGYFPNGENGTCELSFGKFCSRQDSIVFNHNDTLFEVLNITFPSETRTTYLSCDTTVGLICGDDGVCICENNLDWRIDQGCVRLGGGSVNDTTDTQNSSNATWSSGVANKDRNEFPAYGSSGSYGQLQNSQIWELLRPPSNNFQSNGSAGAGDSGDQIKQLQNLLDQQQQLQQAINEISANVIKGTRPPAHQSQPAPLPIGLTNPYLGGQQQTYQNGYQPYWQQNQDQGLYGRGFPILRFFRNVIEPIKRKLFPNLMDAAASFPSPLFLTAATVNSFLPVLRTMDQQFSPMLQTLLELTRPRPRTTPGPFTYPWNTNSNSYNGKQSFQQQQQQSSSQPISGSLPLFSFGNSNPFIFRQNGYQTGRAAESGSERSKRIRSSTRGDYHNRRFWPWW